MDYDGYPEDEELEILKNLDINNQDESFKTLEQLFNSCGSGSAMLFRMKHDYKDTEVVALKIHTGGWSGCETMIEALMENVVFWSLYWYSSTRGGHYIFKGR